MKIDMKIDMKTDMKIDMKIMKIFKTEIFENPFIKDKSVGV